MTAPVDYPHQRLYGAFVHRELSIAWISQALLLGGQHRLDLGGGSGDEPAFHCLEFGCGHGLNLILNAAAHPEGRFFGVDLNPSHVAGATALATELGLANVAFARADLRSFAAGRPQRGPAASWPEQVDLVLAHGVAAWVQAEVRQALVAAAAAWLRPGGVFFCSYNTYPGWLAQSPLVMLCQEEALRAGGGTTAPLIRATVERLEAFLGSEEAPLPLGATFPSLRSTLASIPKRPAAYLEGEFHAGSQPLYVGPMHRLCADHGLTAIGSATLPEQFPALLDPVRRDLVEQTDDPTLRQVLFDLAINQAFRRDLFALGVTPPTPAWRRQTLEQLSVLPRAGNWPGAGSLPTSMGTMSIDEGLQHLLHQDDQDSPLRLGELVERAGEALEDLLPLLSVLLNNGLISLGGVAGAPQPTASTAAAIAAFNDKVVERTTNGAPLGWLVSPVLRQPVPLTSVQAFFRQLVDLPLEAQDVAAMVELGLNQSGGQLLDQAGQPLQGRDAVMTYLIGAWQSFQDEQLPEWRRLGLMAPGAAG